MATSDIDELLNWLYERGRVCPGVCNRFTRWFAAVERQKEFWDEAHPDGNQNEQTVEWQTAPDSLEVTGSIGRTAGCKHGDPTGP